MSMILYPVSMKALSSDIIDVSGLACSIAAKIVPGFIDFQLQECSTKYGTENGPKYNQCKCELAQSFRTDYFLDCREVDHFAFNRSSLPLI